MARLIRWSLMFAVVGFAPPALADIAPPPPPTQPAQGEEVTTVITADFVVKNDPRGATRLVIPKRFTVALSEPAGDESLAEDSGARWRTAIAGLVLSLAVASVVLMRRKTTPTKLVAGCVVLLGALAAGLAVADIPPSGGRARPAQPTIQIEYTAEGDAVTLIRGKGFPR